MLRLKLIIIAAVVFAGVFFILVFLNSNKRGASKENQIARITPAPTIVPTPVVQNYVRGEPNNVAFYFVAPLPNPTAHVSTYRAAFSTAVVADVSNFAVLLGAKPPQNIEDDALKLKSWYWTLPSGSLSLTAKPNTQTLSLSLEKTSNELVIQKLDSLLSRLGFGDQKNIRLASKKPIQHIDGATTQNQRQSVWSYEFVVDGFPVILVNYDTTSVNVIVEEDGAISFLQTSYPPNQLTFVDKRATISLDGALANLKNGGGVLVLSKNSEQDTYGSTPEFTSVLINAYRQVYYFDRSESMLLPAYVFYGMGTNSNKVKQKVEYFLRSTL